MSGCLYYMDYVTVPGGAIWIRTAVAGVATVTRRARPKLRKITYICRGRYHELYRGIFLVWGRGCATAILAEFSTFLYSRLQTLLIRFLPAFEGSFLELIR